MITNIKFPTKDFEEYIKFFYEYCEKERFSVILKGSLAKGTATKYSDIDLIVLGSISNQNIDDIISQYDTLVMTNFTENPKGILILVYKNGICVDLDVRETITQKDLKDAVILLKYEENFFIDNIIRRKTDIVSNFLPDRPEWYKMLRLIHRALIKNLCNKTDTALELFIEIKEGLDAIGIKDINYTGTFKEDIIKVFYKICSKYNVSYEIRVLFDKLFNI